MDAFKMYMAGVITSFVVAATLLGYIATQERVACPQDTYTCPWATSDVLTLESWRGKVSRRTYTFKGQNNLLYRNVSRSEYSACTRHAGVLDLTPEEQAHDAHLMTLASWALVFLGIAFFGALIAPLVATEIRDFKYAREERSRSREREARDLAKQRAWESQRALFEQRSRELEAERARSKAAREEREERKRVKREELEARTLANAERRKK